MNGNPSENKEWFFLGGSAVGALVVLTAGPHTLFVAAAGAVLGLVFAPKSGRETRHEISGWARRLYARAEEFAVPSAGLEGVPELLEPPERDRRLDD